MKYCAYRGCHTSGELPGGLHTVRKAPIMHRHLVGTPDYQNPDEWLKVIMKGDNNFQLVLKWVSCFAMEHHLGMTCDPVGGLVQIPCIERNSMGAIKAITASHLALESNPNEAKVTLDNIIKTMWETAKDMNIKYKETSEGGLAMNIPVNLPEC